MYVEDNQVEVKKRARKERQPWSDENRPVKITKVRPKRLGDYGSFLRWLGRRSRSAAAREIRDRAKGKGQLGGHIHRNFYGLRQFLLARPALMRRFEMEDPNDFTLRGAADVKVALGTFVRMEAADEGDFFKLDTWRTYLPESCGGKPKSGSGTQGNLNRMLPLVARYLAKGLNSP